MSKFVYTDDDLLEIEEPVSKHGEHDQSTHGNWATGGTVYTSIIDRLSQKDETGFSLDISSRSEPTSGYMTSEAGAEKKVPYDEFFSSRDGSRKILLDYMEKNADALSERGAYFGIWVVKDKGTVYLDVSRRYDTRGDAVRAGFANEQQTVYDIENDDYIYMKDEEDDRTNKAVDGGSTNPRQSNDSRGEESLRGGDSQRNRAESPHICLGRHQGVEKHLEGQHDQATHGSWADGRFGADSVKSARDGAKEYAFKAGIEQDDSIDYQKTVANRARAARIADAYDELPTVQEEAFPAYEALATEVEAQFEYMTKTMGVKVDFVAEDPYKTSREMFADVSKGVLKVLSTASTGSHPFLSDDQNDKFRAVHDFFGHAATGRGFGQDGEESAWVHHSQMFTETARGALTTETRGQNSWYNSRGKVFAEQKVALLPEEFWEVPDTFEKSYKVIKFQAGLIPILKHQEHDQSTHGSWANGYSAEEAARMDEMSDLGPAIADLEAILNSRGEGPGSDDLKMIVENDQGLYTEAIEGIDGLVSARLQRLQEEFPNHEYTEQEKSTIYEDVQSEMIDEFIENSEPGYLAGLWMDQTGSKSTNELLSDVTPLFEEIFNTEHAVVKANGDAVTTLTSSVQDVYITADGPTDTGISVKGEIWDSDRNFVGEFERVFYRTDGVWVVEHKLLKLEDDYKNLGFGNEFIGRSEDWYTQKGFGAITIGTGWEGARVWARDGFDWQPESMNSNLEEIVTSKITSDFSSLDEFRFGQTARSEFDSLMKRATNGYVSDENGARWDSIKDFKNNDFPLPNDFVMIGYKDKTQSDYVHPITGDTKKATTWAGERLMDNLNLNYVKVLTAEGRNLFEGPVDRDGDGLVYDGTARERPAPLQPTIR